MSTTITITKSIAVDIELRTTERGREFVATTDEGYALPTTVARVSIYERSYAHDGGTKFTVSGSFVDNYGVEAKVRKTAAALPASFDSESGQFFAYVPSFDAALLLGRKVAEAAVEVALEAGEL